MNKRFRVAVSVGFKRRLCRVFDPLLPAVFEKPTGIGIRAEVIVPVDQCRIPAAARTAIPVLASAAVLIAVPHIPDGGMAEAYIL